MLRRLNMKYSIEKCEWGKTEVSYLGFRISPETWYPDPERIEDLVNREPPKTVKELRGFIAAPSFYNQWIPNAQNVIQPLLTKMRNLDKSMKGRARKGAPVQLEHTAEQAWKTVQDLLKSKIMLWHIDPFAPFHIFSDASDHASGSVLLQYKDGQLHPVAYHLKVFNKCERNYTTTERETLAILHALDKYQLMLLGTVEINVYTDHKSLIALMKSTSSSHAVRSWQDDSTDAWKVHGERRNGASDN